MFFVLQWLLELRRTGGDEGADTAAEDASTCAETGP